jgi:hypothetical protein
MSTATIGEAPPCVHPVKTMTYTRFMRFYGVTDIPLSTESRSPERA